MGYPSLNRTLTDRIKEVNDKLKKAYAVTQPPSYEDVVRQLDRAIEIAEIAVETGKRLNLMVKEQQELLNKYIQKYGKID